MTIGKEKLKALAEAATQGEWSHERFGVIQAGPVIQFANGAGRQQIAMATGADWMVQGEQIANAEFMAAASPATILALLAEIQQHEAAAIALNGAGVMELVAEREALRLQVQQLASGGNEVINAPAGNYADLCKQYQALRLLCNSSIRQREHWRQQSDEGVRRDAIRHRTEADAERDTNARLTGFLEQAEARIEELIGENLRINNEWAHERRSREAASENNDALRRLLGLVPGQNLHEVVENLAKAVEELSAERDRLQADNQGLLESGAHLL